jgi:hypothetical protein
MQLHERHGMNLLLILRQLRKRHIQQAQIPRNVLEHGRLMNLVEPLRQPRILCMQHLVEDHEGEHKHAHGKEVGDRQLVPNQILVLLQVVLQEPAVRVEGAEAVFGVLPHGQVSANEGEDDAADGGQHVRVSQGHPFDDVVVVSSAGAEEGRRVAL